MLADLVKMIDGFVAKYGGSQSDKMKADLLDLIQKAVDHGEGKEQGKLAGIATKIIKSFMGGGKDKD